MLHPKLAILPVFLSASLSITMTAQQQAPANLVAPSQLALALPAASLSTEELHKPAAESSSAEGVIRVAPAMPIAKKLPSQRPFRTVAFGIKANTLGASAELATPLFRSFNLRSGINFLAFAYPFGIDGVNYDANLHFRSSQSTLDWFPFGHSFHISPGILYSKNTVSSTARVPAGQNFSLGDPDFVHSVVDPVHGNMSLAYPRNLSPLLLVGFGNILPRTSRRLSVPLEFGAAYTGAATINVNLTGTACTNDGCTSFASNSEAQASLTQEIKKINEDLKKVPIYPILSLGVAYHF
ncbi:hypothetical protein RBB79_06990 [Tunturiibacter empetritectus]|uniref:Outer membrane protein beta-barrel domain-containing protein n=1 Tax=Tunturiibacter lichenicola TaxID=2051959 RepID=A0A852VEC4_9BACT|nr:hypothetical protein [Edaphobacter lichenicola]NYF89279.1 hypothetical protein [Edaphobacter lichenicola]